MSQTEESSRRLSPSGVRKRWEEIRGIEDEDEHENDDEEENDTPRGLLGAHAYRILNFGVAVGAKCK
jgi:hypothetical protein